MAGHDGAAADVEIVASAAAAELRFRTEPEVRVSFPGTGARESRQVTRRQHIDTPVHPGKTYRRVFVETRISSRLLDAEDQLLDSTGAHHPVEGRASTAAG
jgi:hypothetical protein